MKKSQHKINTSNRVSDTDLGKYMEVLTSDMDSLLHTKDLCFIGLNNLGHVYLARKVNKSMVIYHLIMFVVVYVYF